MSRLVAAAIVLGLSGAAAVADDAPPVDFTRDIAPILHDRCLSCHAESAQGGLQLTRREQMVKGGDSGPAIVAGRSDASRLIQRISAPKDSDEKMPPEGSRLSAEQVETFRRWIDAGAPWPEGLALKSPKTAALEHWAFQPVRRPVVPDAGGRNRKRQSVDDFILQKLIQEHIEPSDEADRVTLLRRATLDLIGLPPSSDEIDEFLADERPDAYERQLDRLFASPHYGERWARPWLDLCHFADTDGYLTDQLRPVAWRYRQWLIDALNADLPFDEFTIQQLAGDLLPNPTQDQLLATGFLRNTLSNREGGADLEQYRVEQVVDRTQIVGVGWLGLSVGCARCHDHKYDPITQKEFYQFYAFLDQADEVNLYLPLPGEAEKFAAAIDEYNRKRAELIAPYQPGLNELQGRWEAKLLEVFANPELDATWNRQWEVLGLVWGGNLGEGQLEGCTIVRTPVTQRTQDEIDRLQDYFLANGSIVDGKAFADLKLSELPAKLNELKKTVPWPTRAPTMRQARFPRPVHIHQRGEFRSPGELVQPDTFAFLPVKLDDVRRLALRSQDPRRGREGVGVDTSGQVRESGSLSPAGASTPAALAATTEADRESSAPPPSDNTTQSSPTRLDLARWLVAPGNPLTPRVVVNRLWQEFFGKGIVDPPNDFGLRGQPPSHPELLDWLASECLRRAWSAKSMHRLVMTSATYRQSSRVRPELKERDPSNRWLARQSALRFTSDQVRDATLAASGLLEPRIGGPSVFPPQPDEVMNEGFYQHGWKASEGPDRYRRAIYTWIARLSPFAQNVTFDSPPTNAICTRRDRTNSPLQALTLLNDPVFFEAAQAFAGRMMTEGSGSVDETVDRMFRRAVARFPTPEERTVLVDYFRKQLAELSQQPATVDKLVPQPVDPQRRVEQAAWTNTASVVLNLHEFITRE